MRASLELLPPTDEKGRVRAVIESPRGTRNKMKYEPDAGVFRITHVLPVGMSFPFDFGFIPGTRAPDGDPLDVLILMDAPAYPGCLVEVDLLGVIQGEQEQDGKSFRNDRIIAMARNSTEHRDLRRLSDLEPTLLEQIEAFFVTDNRLRKRRYRLLGRKGPKTAQALLEANRVRLGRSNGNGSSHAK
jgi:inorganic pyrophosphatase